MKSRDDTESTGKCVEQTIASLLHAAHALEDKVEATLGGVGLSSPKFAVLAALVAAGEPVPLGELAAKLSCVKSNATQLVDRLEADGLVRRVADAADRRSVRAELTPLGQQRHAAGAEVMDALEDRFSSAVCTEDRDVIARLLKSIDSS